MGKTYSKSLDKIIWNYFFVGLNQNYFGGKLRSIPVFEGSLCENIAEYRFDDRGICDILLSTNHGLDDIQKIGVLLHEMCHHAVFEKHGGGVEAHGKEWVEEMRKVGFTGNILPTTTGEFRFNLKEEETHSLIWRYCSIYEEGEG